MPPGFVSFFAFSLKLCFCSFLFRFWNFFVINFACADEPQYPLCVERCPSTLYLSIYLFTYWTTFLDHFLSEKKETLRINARCNACKLNPNTHLSC